MNCPACQTVMREREKESVIVDVCPACKGMWLDHGELEKLIEIERERDERAYNRRFDDRGHDRDYDRDRRGQPRKKKGFLSTLMENLGSEGDD